MLQVLIVDDEPAIRRGLAGLIDWSAQGYEVAGGAADGIEALEWLAIHPADVVISDIKMPAMDGLELVARVRRDRPSVAVIILSGYDDFRYAQQAIRYGVMGYLLKPVEKTELLGLLGEIKSRTQSGSERKDTPAPPFVHHSRPEQLIAEVKRYVDANLAEEHSLRALGERFFINAVYLGQIFKQCMGAHFSDYLTERRVERARTLLAQSDLLVYEIMEYVGFHDSSYFGRQFKRIAGMSPVEYRAQWQNL